MYPELVTRPDLQVFLPPIVGTTVCIIGNPDLPLAVHVHDE